MSEASPTTYRENAEQLWELGSKEVFSNGKAEHAAVIIETFLKKASRRLFIFCRNLAPEVYDTAPMRDAAIFALSRGVKIDVITQEQPSSEKVLSNIETWQKSGNLPISLKICPPGLFSSLPWNFAVADGRAYRFERDRNEPNAVACMNDPKLAARFEEFFSRIKAQLLEVSKS